MDATLKAPCLGIQYTTRSDGITRPTRWAEDESEQFPDRLGDTGIFGVILAG